MRNRVYVIAATIVWAATAPPIEAQIIIDNLHYDSYVSSFGETGVAYYGQSFVAAGGRLDEVTVFLASGFGPDPTDFRLLITETAGLPGGGVHPTSVLFESQDLHLPLNPAAPDSLDDFTQFVVDVGGLPLQSGATYAFVLDNFVSFNGVENGAVLAINNEYADGNFMYYAGVASGSDRLTHFGDANNWINWRPGTLNDHDAVFELVFGVPEPRMLALITPGLACLLLARRSPWRSLGRSRTQSLLNVSLL